jgi:hypothetical protein
MGLVRVRIVKGTYSTRNSAGRLVHYRPPEEFKVTPRVQHAFRDVLQIVGDEVQESPAPNITTRRDASKSGEPAGAQAPAGQPHVDDASNPPGPDEALPPEGGEAGSGSAASDEARDPPAPAVIDRPPTPAPSGAGKPAQASKPLQRRATARKA